LKEKEDRSFPYMANVPVIRINDCRDSFYTIIKSLLLESLRAYYQKEFIDYFMENFAKDKNFTPLSFLPELLTLSNKKGKENFIYPDPPIGKEELDILTTLKADNYNTPLTYINKNSSLKDLKVAISISESQDIYDCGLSLIHLRDLLVELARYLLASDINLIYGGSLAYNGDFNFAEILVNLARTYNDDYTSNKKIINYTERTIDDDLRTNCMDSVDFKDIKPDDCFDLTNDDEKYKTYVSVETLSKMRIEMNKASSIRIVAGGKSKGFSGKYAGILEETYLALKDNKPVFLIGAFGGATKKIIDTLKGKKPEEFTLNYHLNSNCKFRCLYEYYKGNNLEKNIDYDDVVEFLNKKGISGLNNGLNEEENQRLFESKNIYEIIYYILKGLESIAKKGSK
jgi:hypothetical protein